MGDKEKKVWLLEQIYLFEQEYDDERFRCGWETDAHQLEEIVASLTMKRLIKKHKMLIKRSETISDYVKNEFPKSMIHHLNVSERMKQKLECGQCTLEEFADQLSHLEKSIEHAEKIEELYQIMLGLAMYGIITLLKKYKQ